MFRRRRFRSSRVRKARRQRFEWILGLWITVFAAIMLLFVQISQIPQLRIDMVDIVGSKAASPHRLFDVVAEELKGRYLYLFPHRNILLYPRASIEDALLEKFLRLKSVDADIVGLNNIRISVVEREAVGVTCQSHFGSPRIEAGLPRPDGAGAEVDFLAEVSDEIGDAETCYYLDENGYIFAQAPVFSGSSLFVYRREGSKSINVGKYFLQPRAFSQLFGLKQGLEELGLSPSALITSIQDTDVYARHFTYQLSGGTELVFSADVEEFETELQNLQAILASSEFEEESGGDISTIEYIDLRFGNKVFYRLERGEE